MRVVEACGTLLCEEVALRSGLNILGLCNEGGLLADHLTVCYVN